MQNTFSIKQICFSTLLLTQATRTSNCCCWSPLLCRSVAGAGTRPPCCCCYCADSHGDDADPPYAGRTFRRGRTRRACIPSASACAWLGWSFGWTLSGIRRTCGASRLREGQRRERRSMVSWVFMRVGGDETTTKLWMLRDAQLSSEI